MTDHQNETPRVPRHPSTISPNEDEAQRRGATQAIQQAQQRSALSRDIAAETTQWTPEELKDRALRGRQATADGRQPFKPNRLPPNIESRPSGGTLGGRVRSLRELQEQGAGALASEQRDINEAKRFDELRKALSQHPRERMVHILKSWPEHFQAIRRGEKRTEIRKGDRDFRPMDFIDLREFSPYDRVDRRGLGGVYTGHSLRLRIANVRENVPGLMPGYVFIETAFLNEDETEVFQACIGNPTRIAVPLDVEEQRRLVGVYQNVPIFETEQNLGDVAKEIEQRGNFGSGVPGDRTPPEPWMPGHRFKGWEGGKAVFEPTHVTGHDVFHPIADQWAPSAIPRNVYWSLDASNFYDHTRRGMGDDFYTNWYGRRGEFPQSWTELVQQQSVGESAEITPLARAIAEAAVNQRANGLSPHEHELLNILAEECSEVIKQVMKLKRFGCIGVDYSVGGKQYDNRALLAEELGHVQHMIRVICAAEITHENAVEANAKVKQEKLRIYLQSQRDHG